MPIQTSCPSCGKPLRVPDNLIGANVKCPSCQTQFVAKPEGAGPDSPPPLPGESRREEGVREESLERRPRRDEEYQEDRPSRRPVRRDDDDNDEYDRDRDDEDFDRPGRRRRRRSTEYARSKVSGPAICLMITSAIGGIFYALALCGGILQTTGAVPAGGAGQGGFGGGGGMAGGGAENGPIAIVVGVIGVIWAILVFAGALQMKGLKSRGFAMTAAILALIPNHCCLLSLPFGIWALVVLSDAEVKDAFG
jgi:hypothetical protein